MLNSKLSQLYTRNLEIVILTLILSFLLVSMTLLTGGKFLKLNSLEAMAFQMPLLGLLTLAQLIPMLTGGIDLSIISTANLSGIITALILTNIKAWYNVPLAILLGLFSALLVGIFNGFIISFIEVPPIIGTLGSMILIKGISLAITKGYVISGFPDSFLFIGNGYILGVPVSFIIFILFSLLMALILYKTSFGICIYMLGSNPLATLFSGINNKSLLFKSYLISSFLSGVASLVMISRFNAAQADYGGSFLLLTVLICVLGGVSPSGGFGRVLGVFIAVTILQIVGTGFNLLGLSSHLSNALWGIILILVIILNRFYSKTR
ncbi:MAG: sugar ABC transporter permease [Dictyoglomus sp. NZ13-RE01]|nr:MAG: sugar ABC transporter permease [Dictyoglomus sp. NZ13-RE01]